MANPNRYIIDTSVIISYLRGYDQGITDLNNLYNQDASLGCCAPIITEIFAGVKDKEQAVTENLLNALRFYPITIEIAKLAGKFISSYSKKGITLNVTDATIGAVAVAYKLQLITYNKKHYPMFFNKSR